MAGQPQQERAPYRVNIDTTGTKSESKPVDPAAAQRALALEQQRLGLLGQVATVNEQIKSSELAITAARMQPGNKITDADVRRIQDYAKANALGTAQIRAQADAHNLETVTIGMATGGALAYAALQQRINEEKRKGNELSPAQIAALRAEADALGTAAERAENMRFAYEGLVRGPLQTLQSSIASGSTFFDALKKSGVSALNALSSKLMDMAAQNLWTSAFGGSSGGLFSGLGALFGGGKSGELPGFGTSNFVGPTFATGGYTGAGGKYEPAGIVHKGEYVVDAATTARIGVPNLNRLRGYADGGLVNDVSPVAAARIAAPSAGSMDTPVTISMPISIDATGADAAGLARVQSELAGLKAELPTRVVAAVTQARKMRQL